jgi:sigma-B regulation protein RsbU (phosphoserine phosphatase)
MPASSSLKLLAHSSAAHQWQLFFKAGEQLLSATSMLEQHNILVESFKEIANAEVSLWLLKPAYPLPGDTSFIVKNPDKDSLAYRAQITKTAAAWTKSRKVSNAAHEKLALPLIAQDTVLAVVQLERTHDRGFDQNEQELLQNLSAYFALALQANRQLILKNWRYDQINLVRLVSNQIANVFDIDDLARRVTSLIRETFQYYYVGIFTLEPDRIHLRLRASSASVRVRKSQISRLYSVDFKVGTGIIGQSVFRRKTIYSPDVSKDVNFRYNDAIPETRSELAIPIKVEDQVYGVLDIQSNQPDAFHNMDQMVLGALADNIAIAIENVTLYTQLEKRVEQINTVALVSKMIASILDQEILLNDLVQIIHQHFKIPYVHLWMIHRGRKQILFQAGSGSRSQAIIDADIQFDLDSKTGMIPWVAQNGKSALAADVSKDKRYEPFKLGPSDTRSELALPLIYSGELAGVLDLQSDQINAFKEEDQDIYETLADNVATALRNAALYKTQKWRTDIAESLRDVAGMLTKNKGLDDLLNAILEELTKLLPSDIAAIWLLNEAYDPETSALSTELEVAAVTGCCEDTLNRLTNLQAGKEKWFLQAVASPIPIIRQSGEDVGPLGEAMGYKSDYSSVATALMASGKPLGVIALAHATPNRYGDEARNMIEAFASYASVAIGNTRLYASSQEQAWVSTVLLQVASALQSVTSTEEMAATIVRLTPLLVGVKGSAMLLWDPIQEIFSLQAAHGFNHIPSTEFSQHPISLQDTPFYHQLINGNQPVTISDPVSELSFLNQIITWGDEKTASLYPLISHSELLGLLIIAYGEPVAGVQMTQSATEYRTSIITGISQQVAVTIENIHLLDTRQAEAYVTAALLQIAQAVVTMNDLDEILESITYSLPILVGIDNACILMIDPVENNLVVRQALLQGELVTEQYANNRLEPKKIPLLAAVLNTNNPLVLPFHFDQKAPFAWEKLNIDDSAFNVVDNLNRKEQLLIALPLAVKGDQYGVLVVMDESEALAAREKRFEIITGIAQQTSLAIQNERLNHEMIDRERLEREFQLARQIQETFLPSQLPSAEGWDLSIRWMPARQVGGDFYDVFNLPDERIGIVIADVSDKGMPAALYMTVTRTLIRATVREIEKPADVLQKVNSLMMADSESGLFVTAIYAILDTRSGELVYANAGHNLPYVICDQGKRIQQLEGGGISLGAMPEIHLPEHRLRLERGDCLLLYTDGVTDTFSESGEAFGDERLVKTLNQLGDCTSQSIIEEIQNSLHTFRGSAPPSDDVTLVSIRRIP